MVDKEVVFEVGDRVRLTSISPNKEILKAFKVGMTGEIVGFVAEEYPLVKWDKPLVFFWGRRAVVQIRIAHGWKSSMKINR